MARNKDSGVPAFEQNAFACPHCESVCNMDWGGISMDTRHSPSEEDQDALSLSLENSHTFFQQGYSFYYGKPVGSGDWFCAVCESCGGVSFWKDRTIMWPIGFSAPQASEDMPDNVAEIYNEARKVVEISPRSASALLRLALERLCERLKYKRKKLYDSIEAMKNDNMFSSATIDAFHLVRKIGNSQVHVGKIDLSEDPNLALALFELMNMIIDDTITKRNRFNDLNDKIRKSKEQAK